ncbi:hypothetical protein CVT26_012236 [Gymnopilus dilepis]|uniref:Uncharacterized protein n=1 Tax=Gymnopilus dilepis TaxID=231916 RepID=A0A409YQ78_9AGAR|nr:hypothetical protein CVT26_012236 [Gymnopilus dilepis]
MGDDFWTMVVGYEAIFISVFSVPQAILGAIVLSWISNLPVDLRHEFSQALGKGHVGVVAVGMLGGFAWFCLFMCVTVPSATFGFGAIMLALSAFVLWIVFAALTPWHPESKLSSDVLSMHLVRTRCYNIFVMKCLVVLLLCLSLLLVLTLNCISYKAQPTTHIPPKISARISQDGSAEPQARSGSQEANSEGKDVSAPTVQPSQTHDKSVVYVAAMDGAD